MVSAAEWMVSATVIAVALAVGLWVRGAVRRHRRRLPATIGHVRIEALDPVCVDGGVFEQVWRIAILMKNIGRKPAPVPPLAARATVRSGSGEYAAAVWLERDVVELNPGAELVAWVEVELPAGTTPERVRLATVTSSKRPLALVSRMRTTAAGGKLTAPTSRRLPRLGVGVDMRELWSGLTNSARQPKSLQRSPVSV